MKKDTNALVEQKSVLAKLMASENITVEHKKIPTAAFDIKYRVLYLPILKWKPGSDVYDLFCSHEVGHALWTPEEGWHSSTSDKGSGYKSFLNVVEDARIEKKIKRKFPGARKAMSDGYNELMNADFFGIREMGVDVNELNLIDRINLYTKAGGNYGIDFTEEEREWIDRVMGTETFDDVVKVTDALFAYCKENESETDNSYADFNFATAENGSDESDDDMSMTGESPVQMMDSDEEMESDSPSPSEEGEESGEESDSGKSNSSGKEETESSDGPEEESSDESEEKPSESSSEKMSFGPEGGKGNPFSKDEFVPTSRTDENFRRNEESIAEMGDRYYAPSYVTFPKVHYENLIVDYKEISKEISEFYGKLDGAAEYENKLYNQFRKDNEKMISYMVKEFEMKKAADIHRRAYNSKKGTLDMNKIHAYKYSENLFQQITNLPEGKNHAMVMFIDWSGSMSGMIQDTIHQVINLAMFCQKVQIPFEVYAFSDSYARRSMRDNSSAYDHYRNRDITNGYTIDGKKIADYRNKDLLINNYFSLLNLVSSRMRRTDFVTGIKNLLMLADGFGSYNNRYFGFDRRSYFGMPYNFSLGGTPLDDTIITAKSLIEDYKIKTKAQIVNAIFLTDGASSPVNSYRNTSEERGYDVIDSQVVIDDPKTRVRVMNQGSRGGYYRRADTTSLYLRFLKATTGVNLLGFFLTQSSRVQNLVGVIDRYLKDDEVREFRKNKFWIEKGTAYDELYIINSKGLEIDGVDHINEVSAGASKSELRKALKKNTKNKLQNRVMLNAFIEKIA